MAEIKRLNYFTSQFLQEDDFKDEQSYHVSMRRLHNRALHTWGVVAGLEVTTVAGTKKVAVARGIALDSQGREIVLPSDPMAGSPAQVAAPPEEVDLSAVSKGTDVFITIAYSDVDTDEYTTAGVTGKYKRKTERSVVRVDASPPADGSVVILARVSVDAGGNVSAVDNTVRRFASSLLTGAGDVQFRNLSVSGSAVVGAATAEAKLQVVNASQDANGNTLILGQTGGSNLRLGYHNDYTWIQSHGNRPLLINPLSNSVSVGPVAMPGAQGRLMVSGSSAEVGFVKRGLTKWPTTPAAGDRFLWYNPDGTARLWTEVNGDLLTVKPSGFVGIGTPGPISQLHIRKDAAGALGPTLTLMNGVGQAGAGASVDFDGYDTGGNPPSLRIQSLDDGSFSSHLAVLTKKSGAAANALEERLRITSSGNVGIGVPGPDSKLHVRVPSSSSPIGAMTVDVESFGTGANSQASYFFRVRDLGAGPSTPFCIRGDGNVGIGTTSPGSALDVNGAIRAGNSDIYFTKTDHAHSGIGNQPGFASIENDGATYNALMILGRTTGPPNALNRRVRLWDYLEVNGNLDVTGVAGIRQNYNYISGAAGWSSVSYNARHNDANNAWVFPDQNRVAVTVEMDDQKGSGGRFEVYSTTKAAKTSWRKCLALDGESGDMIILGNLGTHGFPSAPKKAGWGGGLRTWDVEAEGTIWSAHGIDTSAHDLAENYLSDADLAPGDVVCLDRSRNRIVHSERPNDELLIGVISTEPGFLLNSMHAEEDSVPGMLPYPVALCGRVPCKVTDENGPIIRGDLLTTSSTPGHAMKATPVTVGGVEVHRPGTIIGKALEPHRSGRAMIEVFVALR